MRKYLNLASRLSLMTILAVFLMHSCKNSDSKDESEDKDQIPKTKKEFKPLFTYLDPQESGVDFKNYLPENEGNNILTYEYLINGGGVAIGDLNLDNLPDIYLTSNLRGGAVFLNQGGLKFKNISKHTGLLTEEPFSTGVAMVDINEDGYLDIYVCRSLAQAPGMRANYLFINNKDLTFTESAKEYGLADESFSNHASFFDYDNDGDLDMYLLNHRSDFRSAVNVKPLLDHEGYQKEYSDEEIKYVSDRLYRNNGDGTFTDVTRKAGVINKAYGLSATVADINMDGWLDIFVANDYSDKDFLYINNQDGTFSDRLADYFFHTSKHSMGSNIADYNNDGLLDLISLDMLPPDNYRLKKMKWQASYDLYHLMVGAGSYHQVMRNNLQLNNGDGTFSEISQLAGISHSDWSWTPLFEDFDNDGYKDLYVSNGYFREGHDMDFMKYESNKIIEKAGGSNKVKNMDLVNKMPSTAITNYFYKNNGDLTFSEQTTVSGLNKPSYSNGAVYADLDLDGDLEIIVNNFNQKSFLFKNNSRENNEESHYLSIKLNGTSKNKYGIGAKVTISYDDDKIQFKYSNPYRGYFSSTQHLLHFGLGDYDKNVTVTVEWLEGLTQRLENVEVDQQLVLDIKNANPINTKEEENETMFVESGNGIKDMYLHKEDDYIDFKREPLLEHMISNKGPFLAQADVNGDGLKDIYLSGGTNQAGELLLQTKDGTYQQKKNKVFQLDAKYEDAQAVFFDFDNDHDQDLYVVSGGYSREAGDKLYKDRLYLNDGQGNFESADKLLPEYSLNNSAVEAGDVDKDGDIDLFVGGGALPVSYPFCNKSQLLINEGGKFIDASDQLPDNGKLGMINDALFLDYDLDGKEELILAGEWMPVTILKREGDKYKNHTKAAGLENTGGWWNCIEVADVNNDDKPDLVLGNRGLNSFYGASIEEPAILYAADFDQNGSVDAVPFYYSKNGISYPKHTMDELFAQYPTIRRKFSRYTKYANAKLNDIFTKEELGRAEKFYVQTFASSCFINQGDGKFTIKELPINAQFSEVHGIVATDLDDDGNQDLIISGNNYGTDVEQGQSDASIGNILMGNGNGDFRSLSVLESGFKAAGDTRGVYKLEDEDQTIIVLRNDDSPLLFKRNSRNEPL